MVVRVLHVDDDPDFAATAAEFVGRANDRFEIHTESSAAAGLERLAADSFDCVVSDYQMPEMDGLEFLDAVRQRDAVLPFILFTGRGSEEVASEAITGGATDYVQKGGIEQYELLANRIANAVDRQRSTRRVTDLERVRTLAADVNQALIRARSAEALQGDVCEIFSDSPPIRLAAIGAVDEATGAFTPRAIAGEDADALERSPIPADDGGVITDAIAAESVATSDDVAGDPAFAPWREADVGFEAVAAVRLAYGDGDHGLLVVYADRSDAFDATEVALLAELGGDIALALDAFATRDRLRDERDRRHALFEHNPSPIVAFRFDGEEPVITAVNPAFEAVFEYAPEEIVDRPATETLVPDEGFELHRDIRRQLLAGDPVEAEVTRQTASGQRGFLLRGFSYETEAGATIGYAWYVDVSEQRAREDRLEEFASIVSHDLRNPLNVAVGNLELAREDRDDDRLAAVADALERMDELIQDVLAMAREDAAVANVEPVELAALVEGCWDAVCAADAELVIDTDATVAADRGRLQQLVENLLRNAVEHGGDDVTVTVGDLNDETGFFVADSGPGIAEADRDRVFERGYSTAEGGNGFGLAIVQSIVDAHGWTVTVADGADGGARFEIRDVEPSG